MYWLLCRFVEPNQNLGQKVWVRFGFVTLVDSVRFEFYICFQVRFGSSQNVGSSSVRFPFINRLELDATNQPIECESHWNRASLSDNMVRFQDMRSFIHFVHSYSISRLKAHDTNYVHELQCVQKKVSPQTFCTDKCKHAPYWTKLSMHSPRSIWVIVAKFHTIPS